MGVGMANQTHSALFSSHFGAHALGTVRRFSIPIFGPLQVLILTAHGCQPSTLGVATIGT